MSPLNIILPGWTMLPTAIPDEPSQKRRRSTRTQLGPPVPRTMTPNRATSTTATNKYDDSQPVGHCAPSGWRFVDTAADD